MKLDIELTKKTALKQLEIIKDASVATLLIMATK